ncbi:IS21 family transposase [Salibacterium qingdaonense]|uniref:Helix-turn-helix domain-containing protein n=3 Tax=Salibacterium qingdaonense TaxID=266892 RepID=A0A1I4R5T1_9BACI|nr:IS21 family transposase [Salibacterium qingdaonense]SFM47336.1 Helix-turn-helix domain-containing protein [Salibacterium qingdaonense]
MNQKYHALIQYVHDGKSCRQIARDVGINRDTVRKYVNDYDHKRHLLIEGGKEIDVQALIESLTEKPTYQTGSRSKRKVTSTVEERIKGFLKENQTKRHQGQRKQQKTMMDMYEALMGERMDISYSTVRRTVRRLEHRPQEAFVKEMYQPGDICEFDWGEVKVTIDARLQVFQMAVFTSAYGNYRWACLFPKQTTECFQEAHARFFNHIGGVYATVVYDNMKVAVKRFVGKEKEPTQGLMELMLYYGFHHRFCNVRRGNEKGHVERSVDMVRRKAFAMRDTFESLEEANLYLQSVCDENLNQRKFAIYEGQTPFERLEEEHPVLFPAPPKWDAALVHYLRADKYATVIVDQNRYSVPDHLVGEIIMVKVYAERIHCFYNEEVVAEHERLSGQHRWNLQLPHVLDTLQKKPGALAGSLALHQANQKLKTIYWTYYNGKEKDFIALCHYLQDETLDNVLESIDQLHAIHPKHVTTDKIKVLNAKKNQENISQPIAVSDDTEAITFQARHQMKRYDQLLHQTASKGGVSS